MKKTVLLLLGISLVFLTGCIETLEEVYLNKDGSGKYNITFDMSEFFGNPMMKGMMEEAMKEGEVDSSLPLGETDTIIYLKDQPDVKGIMSKAVVRIKMSDAEGVFMMNMSFPFENVKQIDQFFQEFNEQGGAQAAGPMAGGAGMFMPSGLFAFSKGKLTRNKAPQAEDSILAGEEGEFMKMFLSSAQYVSVYHLPGKVKKTTIKGAKVNGKTVTVEQSLLDIMEGNAIVDGDILFKGK
jgi:hypothetical protein